MRCSIVIRSFNEEKYIGRLLEGILQQTEKDIEIILVDSGSTDATVAIASHYPVRICHINPSEFTFGRSLNYGISKAKGDYVINASAHIFPLYTDWIYLLLLHFNDAQVGLVYGKQRGNSTTRFSEKQLLKHWYPDSSQFRQTHPFCNNANAAIKRSLWEQHPYDELLPGLEDIDWARWAIEQGYYISYAHEAEIIHVHDEAPRRVFNRYRREAIAFKKIFPHEQFNLTNFIKLYLTNAESDIRYASSQHVLSENIIEILWFRFMQFWGTYQGYRYSGPLTEKLRQTFYYPLIDKPTSNQYSRDAKLIRYDDVLKD